jgi:hypothetical protein
MLTEKMELLLNSADWVSIYPSPPETCWIQKTGSGLPKLYIWSKADVWSVGTMMCMMWEAPIINWGVECEFEDEGPSISDLNTSIARSIMKS